MNFNYENCVQIFKDYKKYEKQESLVWCRYYLDDYKFENRVRFVLNMIKPHVNGNFIMEVKFWDKNTIIKDFFHESTNKYYIQREYRSNKTPGLVIMEDNNLNLKFFEKLLINHYNYEKALDPALNVKILLFVNYNNFLLVFDFYDDRGFIVNYYYHNNHL